MKYALVDGNRVEAAPGIKGHCSFCGSVMYAKCGKLISWHWSHRSKRDCDSWWENETQWHRDWKSCFPEHFQEVIHIDESNGERHIADVKTSGGVVIEFQNSPIAQDELESREKFYANMLWIVNGDREGTLGKENFGVDLATRYVVLCDDPVQIRLTTYASTRLFKRWAYSDVQVLMDFGEAQLWRVEEFDSDNNELIITMVQKQNLLEMHGGNFAEGDSDDT